MTKRKLDDDRDRAELEIKSYGDLTASVARNHPNVKTLRISCFVKATSPCGLPSWGIAVCRDTAERIPFFLVLFPQLEEVHLGGYSVEKDGANSEPFWFSLGKEGVRQQEGGRSVVNASIGVVFELANRLCIAYRTGFLSTRVKILGLFDPPGRFSRYNLLCEEQLPLDLAYGDSDDTRDGVTCKICRNICSSINLEQAMQLRCAEDGGANGNYLGRIEFLGCQLCISSKTKFEVISSRSEADDDLFRNHLLNLLSDGDCVQSEWYSCDSQGSPAEDQKYRSWVLRYARGPTDGSVVDEIKQLLVLLRKKGGIKSSDIVTSIVSIEFAKNFMIGDKIFVTEGTWNWLKDVVNTDDEGRFHVIDMEKYGLFGEDAIFGSECWRDESE